MDKLEEFLQAARKRFKGWPQVAGAAAALIFLIEVLMAVHMVGPGQGLVVIYKWGPVSPWDENQVSGGIIAPEPGMRGIQLAPLGEGVHFLLPFLYDVVRVRQVEIGKDQVGVQVRLFGKELPPGKILAGKGERGIVETPLVPGQYLINTLAYAVVVRPAAVVPSGHVGVVVRLAGEGTAGSADYLVPEDKAIRGIKKQTLEAGTYNVNPFAERIIPMSLRSQLLTMSEQDVIHFPSRDGFIITLHGAVQWRIKPASAAEAFVLFLDADTSAREAIEHKLILPEARSFSRIMGSKYDAAQFIEGDTRTKFQDEFQAELRRRCEKSHIEIEAARITDIKPPQEIAEIIQRRAKQIQDFKELQGEIKKEEQRVSYERTLVLQDREKRLKGVAGEMQSQATQSEQWVAVQKTEALQKEEVAKQKLLATQFEVSALLARARARAEVARKKNAAEAAGLKVSQQAFGGGEGLARFELYRKLAQALQYVQGNTDGAFAEVFQELFRSPPPGRGAGGASPGNRPGDSKKGGN